jgi:hypothetical protein
VAAASRCYRTSSPGHGAAGPAGARAAPGAPSKVTAQHDGLQCGSAEVSATGGARTARAAATVPAVPRDARQQRLHGHGNPHDSRAINEQRSERADEGRDRDRTSRATWLRSQDRAGGVGGGGSRRGGGGGSQPTNIAAVSPTPARPGPARRRTHRPAGTVKVTASVHPVLSMFGVTREVEMNTGVTVVWPNGHAYSVWKEFRKPDPHRPKAGEVGGSMHLIPPCARLHLTRMCVCERACALSRARFFSRTRSSFVSSRVHSLSVAPRLHSPGLARLTT